MKWPADRITNSSPKSFGMYEKAVSLMAQGRELIHLEVGRPCFDTPLHIKEATRRALDNGIVHYGEFPGELKLRKALAEKLKRCNKVDFSPDEIIVTNGLTHAGYSVCMAALDEGDEVILLDPHYPQHVNKVELAGGKVVFAPLDKENGFRIDAGLIQEKITNKTRMIVLVNPSNPTGRVFSLEELNSLAGLAIKNDLFVMADEVYEQILFDGKEHISIASLPGMAERTFSMYAFTKGYAMDGWRLGYVAANRRFIEALLKITVNDVAHVNVFAQEGAYAAITGPQQVVIDMVAEDCRKRDLVHRCLNAMKGVRCPLSEGSIYIFPEITGTGKSSACLASEILEETDVVVESGSFYGQAGEGHLRICFGAESYERIGIAMERMTAYFNK